ncbi:MAG: FliH/SctL family protein [Ottowia sp.]|uniref:FliH/SctL family protein n=1 Tax=Ottowia sp. TaxID=1898956 RepID=UPI0039E6F708
MSYLLTLHRDAELTLATTEPVVPPAQLAPLQDALALAARLSELLASHEHRLAEAEHAARLQGEQAGHAAGAERARQDGAHALADALARLAADQAAQRDELRHALVALAGAMVRRMAAELAPPAVLAALAERAFEHVVPPQPVRLRLPPELVEPVRAHLAQRELAMPVQCVGDAELQGLRCVVESHAGVLLAGLDEVLARTTQSLETHRRAHSSEDAREALS